MARGELLKAGDPGKALVAVEASAIGRRACGAEICGCDTMGAGRTGVGMAEPCGCTVRELAPSATLGFDVTGEGAGVVGVPALAIGRREAGATVSGCVEGLGAVLPGTVRGRDVTCDCPVACSDDPRALRGSRVCGWLAGAAMPLAAVDGALETPARFRGFQA